MVSARKGKRPQQKARARKKSASQPEAAKERGAASPATVALQNLATEPPIVEPLKEKHLIEKSGEAAWLKYLRKRTGHSGIAFDPEQARDRICELYRLCYTHAGKKKLDVVRDFMAFYPDLGFSSRWLAELMKPYSLASFLEESTGKNRLLQALSKGLRRAADPTPRMRRAIRVTRVNAAQHFQKEMQGELEQFLKDLPFGEATLDWISERVQEKVNKLVETYPKLSNVSQELKKLLERRQAYKASVLIAAKLFGVRQRNLQSKPA